MAPSNLQEKNRICLPTSLIDKVLQSLHSKNHGGGNALASMTGLRFYFPRLVTLSRQFVFHCPRCQKLVTKKAQRHTYGYDIVGSPGEKICLDFVGPLKKTRRGHTSLLTLVDVYTRWFHAWPVKDQRAETVIKHLIRDYIPLKGSQSFTVTMVQPSSRKFLKQPWNISTSRPPLLRLTTPRATRWNVITGLSKENSLLSYTSLTKNGMKPFQRLF